MTISDATRYYGAVLCAVIKNFEGGVCLKPALPTVQGAYLLGGRIPLYIKYSKSRRGPWTFNFHHDHQLACESLAQKFGDCITVFVCGTDGMPAVNYVQLREFLDHEFDEQESVSVRRKHGHMYAISGKNGRLAGKVGRGSLISLVETALTDLERAK